MRGISLYFHAPRQPSGGLRQDGRIYSRCPLRSDEFCISIVSSQQSPQRMRLNFSRLGRISGNASGFTWSFQRRSSDPFGSQAWTDF